MSTRKTCDTQTLQHTALSLYKEGGGLYKMKTYPWPANKHTATITNTLGPDNWQQTGVEYEHEKHMSLAGAYIHTHLCFQFHPNLHMEGMLPLEGLGGHSHHASFSDLSFMNRMMCTSFEVATVLQTAEKQSSCPTSLYGSNPHKRLTECIHHMNLLAVDGQRSSSHDGRQMTTFHMS